jgi:tetratricopeptide (TPR) repeat protein
MLALCRHLEGQLKYGSLRGDGARGMMRRILIGLALMLCAPPAWAQTTNENLCMSADPDIKIVGCTAVIQSGQETKANLAVTYNNRGMAYLRKGLFDQAITDFNRAILLAPGDFVSYADRGIAYKNKGLYDNAIADYTKAIAIMPATASGLAPTYYNRGLAYELKGQRDLAVADYRAALKIDPNFRGPTDHLKSLGVAP